MQKNRAIKIILLTAAIYYIIWITEFPCLFRFLTGIPCPACGSAHAINDLFHGNFALSFRRNPFAVPLTLLLIYALYHELFPGSRAEEKHKEKVIVTASVIIFILYLLRTYLNFR